MKQYRLLILTDHTNHSKENSLYAIADKMREHPYCKQLDIATRGIVENNSFFNEEQSDYLYVKTIKEPFVFDANGASYLRDFKKEFIDKYDLIFLRMPPPLSRSFVQFLTKTFSKQFIINNPLGIYETGTKEFLTNFSEICPPLKICKSINDIIELKKHFPIVLKPFREYAGKGIVRIDGDKVWEGNEVTTFEHFIEKKKDDKFEYLGVKFLKNVSQGDKRIVVVDGKIMGASLRLPVENSWLCNAAMGGSSNKTEITRAERNIVKTINSTLSEMGIVMYGVDTLVSDNGERVLSEINATSIGGLPQIEKLTNKPVVAEAANLIWEYFIKNKK